MPSGQNIFGLLEKVQSSRISVNQGQCAVVRNRNAECMRCAEACTSGCISLDDGLLVVNPERCIGCGTCATVCPTCALEAHQPDDAKLFMRCANVMERTGGTVAIACRKTIDRAPSALDREKVVAVTCLGRAEESLIIMLAALGCKRISLVADECESCTHHCGAQTAEAVVATANELLGAWRSPCTVKLSRKFPRAAHMEDDSFDSSKRDFLRTGAQAAKSAGYLTEEYAAEQVIKTLDGPAQNRPARYTRVQADGTLPHFIPGRRRRLIEGLAALGEPDDVMIGTRLWGHVIIDLETCDSCQRCATFCPTEALHKFTEPDGTFGIDHFPSRCVKCRCCEDVCHTGAIAISDEVFATDIVSGAYERYEMKPLEFEPGNLRQMHERISKLIGVEEVYDH